MQEQKAWSELPGQRAGGGHPCTRVFSLPKAPRQMQATLWRLWESSGLGPRLKQAGKVHRHQCSLGTSLLEGPSSSCPPECAGNKAERPPAPGQTGVPCRLCVKLKEGKAPKCPSVETGACQGHPSVDGQTKGRWGESRPTLCLLSAANSSAVMCRVTQLL